MQVLETIAVIVMFLSLGVVASLVMGFFILKLQLPSQNIKEMEKMEEFFFRNKKKSKDVDSFFSEQWKPYLRTLLKNCIILTILSTLMLFLCGIATYSIGVTGGREEGILIFSFMGVLFLWMCFCIGVRLMRARKYNSKFPKAKEDFQRQYPSYTNERLNYEIKKYDNDRIELGSSFVQDDIMWFCSDFLLFGQMRVYSFIFIRYEDIEYILVKKPEHTSYRRITPNLYYRFCIYYQINGKEKKFTFLALSDYPLVWEFKKKNVEVSEVSND